jgi:mRNA interferase MazF
MLHPLQGEVYWANLDPTIGKEIRKRRPVLVVSPNEMNQNLGTVIAAPVTSTHRPWPTRCRVTYRGRPNSIALDQLRCLDVARLGKRIAAIDPEPALRILRTMFA